MNHSFAILIYRVLKQCNTISSTTKIWNLIWTYIHFTSTKSRRLILSLYFFIVIIGKSFFATSIFNIHFIRIKLCSKRRFCLCCKCSIFISLDQTCFTNILISYYYQFKTLNFLPYNWNRRSTKFLFKLIFFHVYFTKLYL